MYFLTLCSEFVRQYWLAINLCQQEVFQTCSKPFQMRSKPFQMAFQGVPLKIWNAFVLYNFTGSIYWCRIHCIQFIN